MKRKKHEEEDWRKYKGEIKMSEEDKDRRKYKEDMIVVV